MPWSTVTPQKTTDAARFCTRNVAAACSFSTKNDSLLPTFRKLLNSFRSQQSPEESSLERWALFGLDFTTPTGFELEKKLLQSGRTQLSLVCREARLEANRWGFAEQLIAKHGLEPWAKSVLRIPKAQSETSDEGVMFRIPGSLVTRPRVVLVRVQPDRNQIITLMVSSRKEKWRPSWDWFN